MAAARVARHDYSDGWRGVVLFILGMIMILATLGQNPLGGTEKVAQAK